MMAAPLLKAMSAGRSHRSSTDDDADSATRVFACSVTSTLTSSIGGEYRTLVM